MNINFVKQQKVPATRSPKNLHKTLAVYNRSSAYTTAESTCEVSMNFSSEFSTETIEKSEDFKSGAMTSTTCGPQSGSLLPSSASEASVLSTCDESEAIYYFGYGPIVNPIVRKRRGCKIPDEDIKTAILYDHRLRFVAGGTATIVAARGWDVKGVLLKFRNRREFEEFRHYDANYDVRDVTVSVIDKTNLDPKNKSDHVSPFAEDELDASERSGPLMKSRMHKSMVVSTGGSSSLNSLPGDSSDEEEEYSCPFSFEPKSAKADPNALKCVTFAIDMPTARPRHNSISENAPYRGSNGRNESVIGKPQERYLKLMADGLRLHEIDETYIMDEILAVNYIPNARDKVEDPAKYKSFPSTKKVQKVNFQKYETKLCKAKDNATHFVIGNRIMRVEGTTDLQHSCVRWLRALAHGKEDITLTVHKTFVDNEAIHIPLVDDPDDLTDLHRVWAEHVLFLYLERGGLTATHVAELSDGGSSLKNRFHLKKTAMPTFGMKKTKGSKRDERASFPEAELISSVSDVHDDGTRSQSLRVESSASPPKTKGFGKKKLFKMGK